MIIVYGWDTVIKNEKLLGKNKCENCDNISDMYLTREVFRIKLFGIPVLWWTTKRAIMCSNCGMIKKLKKAEYEEMKNNPGLIYNEMQNIDGTSNGITNWRECVTDSEPNVNYNQNVMEEQNNKTKNPLSIVFKIILAPILTFVFWFMYLFIVALFLPTESEISDAQGAITFILAIITAIIIVVKMKFGNKK